MQTLKGITHELSVSMTRDGSSLSWGSFILMFLSGGAHEGTSPMTSVIGGTASGSGWRLGVLCPTSNGVEVLPIMVGVLRVWATHDVAPAVRSTGIHLARPWWYA